MMLVEWIGWTLVLTLVVSEVALACGLLKVRRAERTLATLTREMEQAVERAEERMANLEARGLMPSWRPQVGVARGGRRTDLGFDRASRAPF